MHDFPGHKTHQESFRFMLPGWLQALILLCPAGFMRGGWGDNFQFNWPLWWNGLPNSVPGLEFLPLQTGPIRLGLTQPRGNNPPHRSGFSLRAILMRRQLLFVWPPEFSQLSPSTALQPSHYQVLNLDPSMLEGADHISWMALILLGQPRPSQLGTAAGCQKFKSVLS